MGRTDADDWLLHFLMSLQAQMLYIVTGFTLQNWLVMSVVFAAVGDVASGRVIATSC